MYNLVLIYHQVLTLVYENHSALMMYKGKRAGLRLTLQNAFMFLFLGNEVREVFPINSERRK